MAGSKLGTRNKGSSLAPTHRERDTRKKAKRTNEFLARQTGHKPKEAPKLSPRVSLKPIHSRFEENKSGTRPRTELQRPLRKDKETSVTAVQNGGS